VFVFQGGHEFVWPEIIRGDPLAWPFAIHEIAELHAFEMAGLNPFDSTAWRQYLREAHLQATSFELQYLCAWAQQLGTSVPELAIEIEHPLRRGTLQHDVLINDLKSRQGWTDPTLNERQEAQLFWQRIRQRGTP
jgi:hypothetical protein